MGDLLETETMARLYLQQGHPAKALPIFERLLAVDPARASLSEGLARCREMLASGRKDEGVNLDGRLKVLQRMLATLTGEAPPEEVQPPPVSMAPPAEPESKRLEILRAMLARLQSVRKA